MKKERGRSQMEQRAFSWFYSPVLWGHSGERGLCLGSWPVPGPGAKHFTFMMVLHYDKGDSRIASRDSRYSRSALSAHEETEAWVF